MEEKNKCNLLELIHVFLLMSYLLIGMTTGGKKTKKRESVGSRVPYAVNVAGDWHQDVNGIRFMEDPNPNDIRSDTMMRHYFIHGVDPKDEIIFQTYRSSPFGYTYKIPVWRDGSFVLVLLFSETNPLQIGRRVRLIQKYFSIRLDDHMLFPNFAIYFRAGFATAYQEIIPFNISENMKVLEVGGQGYDIDESVISLRFLPILAPPIVNAFYVMRGTAADVPKLPGRKRASTMVPRETIIYAVNAGGKAHTDVYGIHYQEDPLLVGEAFEDSTTEINRAPTADAYLYQTVRYASHNFGYKLPLDGDGLYALVLKFAELRVPSPRTKVFNIRLNNLHIVVENLDIFALVGFATAHEEIFTFEVEEDGTLLTVGPNITFVKDGHAYLEFEKGDFDNPQINAFYLYKGDFDYLPPPLSPITPGDKMNGDDDTFFPEMSQVEKDHDLEHIEKETTILKVGGPVSTDTWKNAGVWASLFPILMALLAVAITLIPFVKHYFFKLF